MGAEKEGKRKEVRLGTMSRLYSREGQQHLSVRSTGFINGRWRGATDVGAKVGTVAHCEEGEEKQQ